jgi:hypothetical protein
MSLLKISCFSSERKKRDLDGMDADSSSVFHHAYRDIFIELFGSPIMLAPDDIGVGFSVVRYLGVIDCAYDWFLE